MSSLETISDRMTPASGSASVAHSHAPVPQPAEPAAKISRDVAHELNNVLTIVRGYADRLLQKHGDNPALRPELQLISNNARRAEKVIRAASQTKPPLPGMA